MAFVQPQFVILLFGIHFCISMHYTLTLEGIDVWTCCKYWPSIHWIL